MRDWIITTTILDTAPENYHNVIGTRRFDDRLSTLGKVRRVG